MRFSYVKTYPNLNKPNIAQCQMSPKFRTFFIRTSYVRTFFRGAVKKFRKQIKYFFVPPPFKKKRNSTFCPKKSFQKNSICSEFFFERKFFGLAVIGSFLFFLPRFCGPQFLRKKSLTKAGGPFYKKGQDP